MNDRIRECALARERLSAVFDGEADRDAGLEQHLRECAACARFADEIARISADLHALRAVAPPDSLWTRIEARAAQRARRAPPAWALRAAAGLIGFAGVGAAGLVMRSSGPARPVRDPILGPIELLAAHADASAAPLVTPEDHLLRSVLGREEIDR